MRVVHRYESNTMAIELSMSDDKLKLFAKVTPKDEHEQALEIEFLQELVKVSNENLIETAVVKDIITGIKAGKACEGRRVAKGEPPVLGRDGKLVWLVRRFKPGATPNATKELADFYNLGLFENIEAGKEVARIYRPTGGTAGFDVLGKPLPSRPGKAFNARFDRTIDFKPGENREDYQTLVATVSGYAHEEGEKVSIRDVLDIQGNLDYEMGHIDFIGGVRVAGDVQKGFHIKARGDIEVIGSVLGENHLTSEASITVRGFHQGGQDSIVRARANYTVSIAQTVTAEVGGTITVQREARDCNFRASVSVMAPQATVIGGVIWCVKGFEGKTLGNEMGVRTVVELRNELEVTPEYRRLEENIKRHEAALAALELHIGPYLQNRKRVPLLNPKFKMKMTELINKYDGVAASLQKLQDAMKKIREAKPIEGNSRVNVLGMVHAGVVLNTTVASHQVKESQKGPISFRPMGEGSEWIVEGYQSLLQG